MRGTLAHGDASCSVVITGPISRRRRRSVLPVAVIGTLIDVCFETLSQVRKLLWTINGGMSFSVPAKNETNP
jgi:hypothetical protein